MAQETFTITLAGVPRELRFDMQSVSWFERKFGYPIIPAITTRTGAELSVWLLLAGLRGAGTETTYQNAENMIQAHIDAKGSWAQITKDLMEALRHFGFIPTKEYDPESETRPNVARLSAGRAE